MQMTAVGTDAPLSPPKPVSYLRTVLDLFVAPSRAFHSLLVKPRWLIPFVLCVTSALIYEAATSRYRMEEIKESIRSDPTIPADQARRRLENIDSQRTHGVSLNRLAIGAAVMTAAHAVNVFGLALILWLALQLYSTRVAYMTLVAGCSFIFLLKIVEALIKIPLILAKESTQVYLGPVVILPPEWIGSPLFNLLDRIDLFDLWTVALLAICFPILAGISRKKAVLTVGYLWSIWLLGGMFLGNIVRVN